ncbi:MAG: zinc ribbon domain-containing protein [Clostridia bacterium]|nr:zinc ribbon domain-containing protein [Clostridia bacterium]
MDFITTVKEKAEEIAVSTVKASNAVVETVKSNFAIAEKEQAISKILKELGELMYDAYKNGEEPDAETVAEKCVQLDESYKIIEDLKAKIKEIKNVKTCAACGRNIKAEHKFCPNCGEELGK